MTTPAANFARTALSDADWRRMSPQTRGYASAIFELLGIAEGHLANGDLR